MSINPNAIICILVRLFSKHILELVAVGQSIDKLLLYTKLILSRKILHRLLILAYFGVEMVFLYSHASVVKNHKEW